MSGRASLCRAGIAGVVVASALASVVVATGSPAAASTKGTAPVTTCAVLASGSSGAAVKTIQKAVGAAVDGDFGPQTKAALTTWQTANHVTASGVVDAATWAALPAKTARRACAQTVAGSGVTLTCTVLSSGDSGVAVAVLQKALGVTVDGDFGAATSTALKAAQTAAKLPADATTDKATWKALKLLGTPVCAVVPKESADAKKQAKIRKHVDALAAELEDAPGTTTNQVALKAMKWGKKQVGKPYIYGGTGPKGYDCSGLIMTSYLHAGLTVPRVAADQYATGGTRVSLADAQQGDLLFYASDVSKPSTVYHVVMYVGHGKVLSAPYTGTDVQSQPLWTTDLLPKVVRPTAELTLPLKSGATGWSVTQLQLALDRHGDTLTADGGFGPATKAAVEAWQTKHKLTANGVVTIATWLTLG